MNRRSKTLESLKFAQKKRKKIILTTLLSFLCFILAILVIILFFRLSFFQISKIKVVGTLKIDISSIEKDVFDELLDDYAFYIPKSNTFFYPKEKIENKLLRLHKEIDTVSIRREGLSGILININERKAEALICNGFFDEDNEGRECFSVDKDGYVFEKSPFLFEEIFTRYYFNSMDNKIILGTYFIDIDLFKQLQKFTKTIQEKNISTNGILIGEDGQYELYIKNPDLSDCIVYFDDRVPFDKTAENLIAFWNNSQNNSGNIKKQVNYDYINLRFGNNIFYVTK
jgi:hypothetical protein